MVTTPPAHGGPSGSVEDELVTLDFSVSLNAYGPPDGVVHAARNAPLDRYPDPTAGHVRRAAASHWQIDADTIAFGAGASELLHAICAAFLRPGDAVLIPSPTFGEYHLAAQRHGASVFQIESAHVPFSLSLPSLAHAILQIQPRLVFLCTPNNPTGEALDPDHIDDLINVCRTVGTICVLDLSFDAFTDRPLGTLFFEPDDHLIVLRSITKEYALAGIRAGFAISTPEHIQRLEQKRPAWPTSTVAQAAAAEAFSAGAQTHAQRTIGRLREERVWLEQQFGTLGITTIPTTTHYLLAHLGARASEIRQALITTHGIRVRDCHSFNLGEYIRVAARTRDDNSKLVDALHAVLNTVAT